MKKFKHDFFNLKLFIVIQLNIMVSNYIEIIDFKYRILLLIILILFAILSIVSSLLSDDIEKSKNNKENEKWDEVILKSN